MTDETSIRLIAGDCTTEFTRGPRKQHQRGRVAVVLKPDDTVLVHGSSNVTPRSSPRPTATSASG